MKRYTKTELSLLIACLFAYTAAYISRCNLAPALDAIAKTFQVSAAEVGLLPTCFALPYALGQVFSGFLADRYPAPRLMLIGLAGSALINVLFSFCPWFPLLVLLWLLNGVLQSLIWTPIVRIVAVHFRDSVRDNAAFFISLTLILGNLSAWALSGLLTSHFTWRVAFLASGLVTAAIAIPSILFMKRQPVDFTAKPAAADSTAPQAPISHLLLRTNLPLLLIACFANGYVRDGITNWATKLLMDTQGIDLSSAVGIILIIPGVNFLGIQLGKLIYKRTGSNVYLSAVIMFLIGAVMSLLLTPAVHSLIACTAVIILISAMTYGVNPQLVTIMPMAYSRFNRVALAAGLIDALIYVGSAFSGSFVGWLSDSFGWTAVFASWAVMSLIGLVMIAAAGHTAKKSGMSV